jgi:hypothetical protein
MLRPTVSRPICLGIKNPFGAWDKVFITVGRLQPSWCGALSLMRRRVCLLPEWQSAVISLLSMYNLHLHFIKCMYIQHSIRPLSVQAQYSRSCPVISSCCYNSSQITWTVVCLIAVKINPSPWFDVTSSWWDLNRWLRFDVYIPSSCRPNLCRP